MKGVKIWAVGCLSIVLSITAISRADGVVYHNGFENAGDETAFINNANGQKGSNIVRVNSGQGLGYTASSGNYYAVISNTDDAYPQPNSGSGVGDSTFTFYGDHSYGGSGPFTETVDYYVDTAKWLPVNGRSAGFYIDSSPAGLDGHADYLDEVNFRISVPSQGQVNVSVLNSGTIATITNSGWYTFSMSFDPGSDGVVHNTLEVLNHNGDVVGNTYAYTSTMRNSDLTGTRYGDWTTVWQNGFAGDQLAIDNVDVTAAPLPSALWTGLALLGGLVAWGLIRRRNAAAAA